MRQQEELPPHYCQSGVEVHVLYSAAIDTSCMCMDEVVAVGVQIPQYALVDTIRVWRVTNIMGKETAFNCSVVLTVMILY